MSAELHAVELRYLKSTSELHCVINKNQGTFDFMNKSKLLLGLESGRLEVVVYLKSTSELNSVINKNQGTFDFINKINKKRSFY